MYRTIPYIEAKLAATFTAAWGTEKGRLLDTWFEDAAPATAPLDWPGPPEKFLSLHDPHRMQLYWLRLVALLRSPVQEVDYGGGFRAFHVLGAEIYLASPSGKVRPYVWNYQRHSLVPVWIGASAVMVTEMPCGSRWLERLADKAARYSFAEWKQAQALRPEPDRQEMKRLYPCTPEPLQFEYFEWMFEVFGHRIPRIFDLHAIRVAVRNAICPDEGARKLAHNFVLGSLRKDKASLAQYNVAVLNQRAFASLQREAPNVVPLFAALCEYPDFPAQGEATQRLRRFLAGRGFSSGIWRMMLRDGKRMARHIRTFYSCNAEGAALDFLTILSGLRRIDTFPARFLEIAFRVLGDASQQWHCYRAWLTEVHPSLAHVARILPEDRLRDAPDLQRQLALVVRWLASENVILDRRQRQAGWAFLVRCAERHLRLKERRMAVGELTWVTPFDTMLVGDWKLVAMRTARLLFDEAQEMGNCLENRVEFCACQNFLIVSVRTLRGKRIANAEYWWMDTYWKLKEAKAPANRELGAGTLARLHEVGKLIPDFIPRKVPLENDIRALKLRHATTAPESIDATSR